MTQTIANEHFSENISKFVFHLVPKIKSAVCINMHRNLFHKFQFVKCFKHTLQQKNSKTMALLIQIN